MKRAIEAKIVDDRLGTDAVPLPEYATEGAAGIDLRACIANAFTLAPGGREKCPTGLAVNINDPGLAAIVASRSGLSLRHGVRVAQGCGVIDADYHGEIGVILANDGDAPYRVEPGARIAQLLFVPVVQVDLCYTEAFSSRSARDTGGFGHTGTN